MIVYSINLMNWLVMMWQERVLKCIKMLQDLSSNSNGSSSASSVPQSPNGVLDAAACLSYNKSDDINDGSSENSSHNTTTNSPDAKRRKLNKTCGVELL